MIFKVLKEKRPEDEEIDKKLEDGLKNKDINEPFNQDAVQEEHFRPRAWQGTLCPGWTLA